MMVRFKINPTQLKINRRKQCFILKTVVPFVTFLVLISFLSTPNFPKDPHNNSSSETISDLESKTELASLAIGHDRNSILKENTDEFLEVVLKNLTFTEVDLPRHLKLNIGAVHDTEIEAGLAKIKPGLGEDGEKASLPAHLEVEAAVVEKKDAFNRLLSELIAYDRSLPDTREAACRNLTYDTSALPSMSVIIIYTNEAFVSIVRMLHSLINRTPVNLLQEIILVDDFSDHGDLKGKLERYLATRLPVGKIRLIRLSKRSGLIRARMIGAHVATGDVLVFLDAHCEVISEWSEPLLQRIKEKRSAVVVPVIDVIDSKTMEYYKGTEGYFYIGGFKWTGSFYWIKVPEYEEKSKKHHSEPTRTPTMAGGLFAIDRRYFWEMGSYDPDMEIWGGENLEMSFRIWQCGGSVETIPCSRVGHIFRPFRPYSFDTAHNRRNVDRLTSVWMDEYKSLVFQDNTSGEKKDMGDISLRLAFRKRKKCKSFQWYLDNIYREKFRMQRDSNQWGQLKNQGSGQCLDDMGISEENAVLQVYPCHPKLYPSQTHFLSKKNELRREVQCASGDNENNRVMMKSCDDNAFGQEPALKWTYDHYGRLVNKASGKCLKVQDKIGQGYEVVLESCSMVSRQKWIFNNFKKS